MWDNSWLACSGHIIRGEPASRPSAILLFLRFSAVLIYSILIRRKTLSEFIIFSFFHSSFLFLLLLLFLKFLLLYNFFI